MKNKFDAKVIDGFVGKKDCEIILNFAKETNLWESIPNNFWDGRTINYTKLPIEIKNIFHSIMVRMQSTLHNEYNLEEKIYPDTIDLVRWFDGMKQTPHCDNMSDHGPDGSEFHRFGHRYFGCVIYINEDYEGGKTYYPDHNFEITPKIGRLAIHLGDCNHRHGVTEVKKNIRYTVASFWSFDKIKAVKDVEYV